MTTVPEITLERDANVAIVPLRAPERRHALTAAMVHERVGACDETDHDLSIGAVVLAAEGQSWCSAHGANGPRSDGAWRHGRDLAEGRG